MLGNPLAGAAQTPNNPLFALFDTAEVDTDAIFQELEALGLDKAEFENLDLDALKKYAFEAVLRYQIEGALPVDTSLQTEAPKLNAQKPNAESAEELVNTEGDPAALPLEAAKPVMKKVMTSVDYINETVANQGGEQTATPIALDATDVVLAPTINTEQAAKEPVLDDVTTEVTTDVKTDVTTDLTADTTTEINTAVISDETTDDAVTEETIELATAKPAERADQAEPVAPTASTNTKVVAAPLAANTNPATQTATRANESDRPAVMQQPTKLADQATKQAANDGTAEAPAADTPDLATNKAALPAAKTATAEPIATAQRTVSHAVAEVVSKALGQAEQKAPATPANTPSQPAAFTNAGQALNWLEQSQAFTRQLSGTMAEAANTTKGDDTAQPAKTEGLGLTDLGAKATALDTTQALPTAAMDVKVNPQARLFSPLQQVATQANDTLDAVQQALKTMETRLPGQVDVGVQLKNGDMLQMQVQAQRGVMQIALQGVNPAMVESLSEQANQLTKTLESMGYQLQTLRVNGEVQAANASANNQGFQQGQQSSDQQQAFQQASQQQMGQGGSGQQSQSGQANQAGTVANGTTPHGDNAEATTGAEPIGDNGVVSLYG